MRAVVSVVGKDGVGILAKVSAKCAEANANIVDVNQTIMQDMFCMIMLIEVKELNGEFTSFVEDMSAYGDTLGMKINVMHEDIFRSMHTI